MPPLLLLLLVGGALAVASASSRKSSAPFFVGLHLPQEKFEDPIYICFGGNIANEAVADDTLPPPRPADVPPYTIWSNKFGIPMDLGQAYLSKVPPNAASRIAAIRAKMGPRPVAAVKFSLSDIGRIAEASYQKIQNVSSSIINVYKDTKNYANIASAFGIPVATMTKQAEDVLAKSKDSTQSEFLEQTAKYRPIAETLGTAILQYATTGSFDSLKATSLVGHALASAVGGIVPVVGQAIALSVDLLVGTLESRKAAAAEICKIRYAELQAIIKQTLEENFPIPFHLEEDGAPGPCAEHGDGLWTNMVYWGSFYTFRNLSPNDKANVQQWWALAETFMSHPEVLNAFEKLGHGKIVIAPNLGATLAGDKYGRTEEGSLYGGMLASDEQVMLVAAPIAVANGLDVDDFARKLWDKSKGWRNADPKSIQKLVKGYRYTNSELDDTFVERYTCPNFVTNAWWLQWAVLARDAFALAKTLKK